MPTGERNATLKRGQNQSLLLLVGGPAGAGKSTLAAAWCATRERAVHVQLDEVRDLIVAGRADPQVPDALQGEQYALSVHACCSLTRVFLDSGYDVALDDVLEPNAFAEWWRPLLGGLNWRLVVLLPSLDETLRRSRGRAKRVLEQHTRSQHAACSAWPPALLLDTTNLSVAESLRRVETVLRRSVRRETASSIRGDSILTP